MELTTEENHNKKYGEMVWNGCPWVGIKDCGCGTKGWEDFQARTTISIVMVSCKNFG